MRIIDIQPGAHIELWPGRRIQVRDGDNWSLLALPKGAMSFTRGKSGRGSISFGNVTKSLAAITASNEVLELIWAAYAEQEAPPNDTIRKVTGA